MPKRLTQKFCENAEPTADKRLAISDAVSPGLQFRVTEAGVKSWSLLYRFEGQQRRVTIGPFPKVGVAKARELAEETRKLVEKGIDPRIASANAEAAEATRKADTVASAVDRFAALYASQRRWADLERILRSEAIPAWGERPVSDITRKDAMALLDSIQKRAPVRANRVLSVLRVFFKWCRSRDLIEASPVVEIEPPTEEYRRERELTEQEIVAFWRASETLGYPFGRVFQLLLLTACRRDEIGAARWSEVTADATLEIPSQRYKLKRPHIAPLSRSALAIVEALPRIDGTEFIFTTTGKTPVSGWSRAKEQLDTRMLEELRAMAKDPAKVTLPEWRLHDLRRTARTGLSKLGVSPDIGEMVLGHAIGGIRGVYDRYGFLPEKRAAIEKWGSHVMGLLSPPADGGKVITMVRR